MITLAERLRQLRAATGLSQEALGAQGFVSTAGWVKLENGQRSPSEDLLHKLVSFLTRDKHVPKKDAASLRDELLTLKYLGSNQPFVRDLAGHFARSTEWGQRLLATVSNAKPRRRGRPAAKPREAVAR